MGKFNGVLLCTDLDGTALANDRSLSSENREAIEYFKSEGGAFTFVTGRMPYLACSIAEMLRPNVPFGCINGGGLYDAARGVYLWKKPLPSDVIELVDCVAKAYPAVGIQVNTFDRVWFCRENDTMEKFRAATGAENNVCSYEAVAEPMAKILFGTEKEEEILGIEALLKRHPRAAEFDFIRSEQTLYEILPHGVHKGKAIEMLCREGGIDPQKTIAMGDYYNDVPMLRAARLGIAVANACPEARAAADHITVSNEEHALARVIADLDAGRFEW